MQKKLLKFYLYKNEKLQYNLFFKVFIDFLYSTNEPPNCDNYNWENSNWNNFFDFVGSKLAQNILKGTLLKAVK